MKIYHSQNTSYPFSNPTSSQLLYLLLFEQHNNVHHNQFSKVMLLQQIIPLLYTQEHKELNLTVIINQ